LIFWLGRCDAANQGIELRSIGRADALFLSLFREVTETVLRQGFGQR
jgi:hypothetical protein